MNKYKIFFLIATLFFMGSSLAVAGTPNRITVLPFAVHSAENIDYVRDGIADMLSSRLAASDGITVTEKDAVAGEVKKHAVSALKPQDVTAIGKRLNSSYVVWGSITKIGQSLSIDAKLHNVSSGKSDADLFSQSQTLDDVIPKMNEFANRIVNVVHGKDSVSQAPAVVERPVATPQAPAEKPATVSRESQIIADMRAGGRGRGTLTSVINPEFINAADPGNRTTRRGFWMSQVVRTEFKGMAIGDVTGDGQKEIVTIDKNTIYIYRKEETELKLLHQISGKSYNLYISVDIADINRDGVPEIIVTSLNNRLLDSFALQYLDGEFVSITSNIRYFLRVIDTASGIPMLLGQTYGIDKVFDTSIYEMVWRDGKYVAGERQMIPQGLSIYGLSVLPLTKGGPDRIIALDELDYLRIIEKTNKPLVRLFAFGFPSDELLWRSDTPYGGSNNYIANIDRNNPGDTERSAFANKRILSLDFDESGKREFIVVKNLSAVGRIFKNIKLFTSSEIYSLQWDGLGLSENWRTRRINGYVADYAIHDINNDGKPKLILALVTSVGASVSDRSAIVIYELNIEE